MADSEEKWIRQRAYALWEEEGYPTGKDQEHWDRAKREYAELGSSASSGAAKGKRGAAAPKGAKAAGSKTAAPAKGAASKASSSDGAASKKSTAKSAAATVDAALGEAPSDAVPKATRSKAPAKGASSAKNGASAKAGSSAKESPKSQAAMPESVEPVKKRSKKVSASASS